MGAAHILRSAALPTNVFHSNMAPFDREIKRVSNNMRIITKKHCYNKEIIHKIKMSILFAQYLLSVISFTDELSH